jgi:hypothetical protein
MLGLLCISFALTYRQKRSKDDGSGSGAQLEWESSVDDFSAGGDGGDGGGD